jgi:hypothetical protein
MSGRLRTSAQAWSQASARLPSALERTGGALSEHRCRRAVKQRLPQGQLTAEAASWLRGGGEEPKINRGERGEGGGERGAGLGAGGGCSRLNGSGSLVRRPRASSTANWRRDTLAFLKGGGANQRFD